ncbi:MAG: DNA polymerase III subunit beta [Firmicutes bacterium]|nr:DNA polymerase III subunit beta [Bacillota bacterium]
MKFKCQQNQLSSAISMVSKAVSSKTTLPILSGIFFEASNNQLKVIGNDLNLSIETSIEATIIETGSVVIPARLFSELIRKLPNEEITFNIGENYVVEILCGESSYKIVGLPGHEYPELPVIDQDSSFLIDKELFANMIRQTSFAISQDESRPILTGALLEIENGRFNMVAIDGFRMAIKKAIIKTDLSKKAVVPGRTLNEINKLLSQSDSKGDLRISFDDKQVLFSTGDLKVYSRLLAGEFINYHQILPSEYKSMALTETDSFLTAIDRSFLMARENKNVAIKLEVKDDFIKITSNSEMGSSIEKVHIKLEGHDLEIGFNPKYLIDALKIIDSESIKLEFVNNVSPCIIRPADNDNYIYLVLPCRISK